MDKFEYIGGRIWAIIREGADGYEYHVISVEIEKGKMPTIASYVEGEVTKQMVDMMLELIFEQWKE